MSIDNLDKFFLPRSAAVIGAGRGPRNIGTVIFGNLINGGFPGPVFPVNPKLDDLMGRPCFSSLSEVPQPLDLAIIASPLKTIPGVIRECARLGIPAAVVVSGKGREAGLEGAKIEEDLKKEALSGGIRLLGPNSLGLISTAGGLNAALVSRPPLPGRLALITQSGGFLSAMADWAIGERIGFSHLISLGGAVDVGFGDLIDYLGFRSEVGAILLYIESLDNIRQFMSAARAVSRIKPIVVLKAGRTRAAVSGKGPFAAEDDIYDQVFRRSGLVRVQTVQELFDCAELLAGRPRPQGPRLAVISNFGGPAVMAVDELTARGGVPAVLSDQTLTRLNRILPPSWSRGNPVDILGDADAERYLKTVEILTAVPEVDGLVIIHCPWALTDPAGVALKIAGRLVETGRPTFTVWMGGESAETGRRIFREMGLPTYSSPERAVRAFLDLHAYEQNLRLSREIPRRFSRTLEFDHKTAAGLIRDVLRDGRGLMTEAETMALLGAYGFPVVPALEADSADEAAAQARRLGYPATLKLVTREGDGSLTSGGAKSGLENEVQLRRAFEDLVFAVETERPAAEIHGVVVQPTSARPDFELLLGARKDPRFGPVLYFGLGGSAAEAAADVAAGLPPLNRLLAGRMIEETRVFSLLKAAGFDPALVEELLARLSHLTVDFPQIVDLRINPLALVGTQALVLEARVEVETSPVPAPLHLVVSPYPDQYETTETTKGGLRIHIRPIRPEDGPLMEELFGTLSDRSIYLRFCRAVRSLSPEMLARFTQVDYDREIALAALDADSPTERMLGVARAICSPDDQTAELAVVVGDPWQGRGVGACLFQRCMEIALEKGRRRLFAFILAENRVMKSLVRKLGWECARTEDGEYYYQPVEGRRNEAPILAKIG
ncbi:MAG: GNAT family N-acetyltransferase [Pseudomonadota bacterium]